MAPSTIAGAGVGVMALKAIASGVDPFAAPNPELQARDVFIPLQKAELARLPAAVREYALCFFPQLDDENEVATYAVPANGFASFDASWYVNHADQPNVAFTPPDEGEPGSGFHALRDIAEGEELLMDYRDTFPDLHARISGVGGLPRGKAA